MNHGSIHGLVYGLVQGLVSATLFMVYGVLHNVLLEHGGQPCLLPSDVHLDIGHPPETQGYLVLLSEPFNPTQTF